MKKLFVFALLTVGIAGTTTTTFAQDKTVKKEAKMDKKEDKGKVKKADKKDAKATKKEVKGK